MAGFDMNFFSACKALTADTGILQLIEMSSQPLMRPLHVFLVDCLVFFLDLFLCINFDISEIMLYSVFGC